MGWLPVGYAPSPFCFRCVSSSLAVLVSVAAAAADAVVVVGESSAAAPGQWAGSVSLPCSV